jgi:phospholipase C
MSTSLRAARPALAPLARALQRALARPALCGVAALVPLAASAAPTTTPIKHLVVVVGENVSFDTLFGTYQPGAGQTVNNLLSQGIVNADGTPGPQYATTNQRRGVNDAGKWTIDPKRGAPYKPLPQPTLIGAYDPLTFLPYGPIPDARFAGLTERGSLPITKYSLYGEGLGDPAHRFFQMWQQTGGDNARHDLFAWVATTVGTGGATSGVTPGFTGQGGELMGFYNMARGDAPWFRSLAQQYALADNYHQSVMGGTGANFFAIATGDAAVYNVGGVLAVPPTNQIENPDPLAGFDNFYTNDGYQGGSYVNCADRTQPGVVQIHHFLAAKNVKSKCAAGAYYLVNNYEPPYTWDFQPKPLGADQYVYPPQTVPTIGEALSRKGVSWRWYTGGRDTADITSDAIYPVIYAQVFAAVKAAFPPGTPDSVIDQYATPQAIATTRPLLYNTLGDPHVASSNVVNSATLRANLSGLATFYADVAAGSLPEVSYVVPKNLDSGHPGYSVTARYELFLQDLVAKVQANPALWADTAIVITTDEGGGYFDTGAIQTVDFFGDGPRIPLIVVSPYARAGVVDHTYQDHASVLKFIERNWSVPPLSKRSRDNLPAPVGGGVIPSNAPAIGDLTGLFDFTAPTAARR